MEREFRGAGLHHKLDLRIKMGDMGDPSYSVEVDDWHEPEDNGPAKRSSPDKMMEDLTATLLSRKGCSENYIGQQTGYNAKQIRETIDLMISKKLCYLNFSLDCNYGCFRTF